MTTQTKNKNGFKRNGRGEIEFKLNDKTVMLSPTFIVIDKLENDYDSLFKLDKFLGGDDKGNTLYKTSDLADILETIIADLQGMSTDDVKTGIIKKGMFNVEIVIRTFLQDITISGTDEKSKAKSKGK